MGIWFYKYKGCLECKTVLKRLKLCVCINSICIYSGLEKAKLCNTYTWNRLIQEDAGK